MSRPVADGPISSVAKVPIVPGGAPKTFSETPDEWFLDKALNGFKNWGEPTTINTENASIYGVAIFELRAGGKYPKELVHRQVKYLNKLVGWCD